MSRALLRICKWFPACPAMAMIALFGIQSLQAQGQKDKERRISELEQQADTLQAAWKSKMQLQLIEQTALEGPIDPETYILGPGDEVVINMWGPVFSPKDLSMPPSIPVTPEGKILIPHVGDVSVGNMSLADATRLITAEVAKKYRNVTVSVNLSKLRQFRVFVLGEVNIPGTFLGWPVDRVSTMIDRAAGFTERSSQRRIEVRRKNGNVLSADLVLFRRLGQLDSNPQVLEGDIVFVPVQLDSVTISGAVHLPGNYEYRGGDLLKDLIMIAGGLTGEAHMSTAEIVRFNADGLTTTSLAVDLDTIEWDDPVLRQCPLVKDDRVYVRSKPEWRVRRTVTIDGAVRYPGEYAIEKDISTLSSIIDRAGGFMSDASLDEAKVIRRIYREIVDPEYERLRVMEVADMTDEEREYFKTKSREQTGVVVVDFERLFTDHDMSQDIILKPLDIISVPVIRNTVTVSGAVENPGSVIYQPDQGIEYYIGQAGGYTLDARKSKVKLIKGNTGVWLRPNEVREIKPGDTVWVPEKPERNWWTYAKDFISVAAQVATLVIVVDQLGK